MKWKDLKPVFLSACLVVTSIGSPGKVFAETKAEYVTAETVFEECPLNRMVTMDYNGDLSTWTECTDYYTYFYYSGVEDPFLKGNKITYNTGVPKPSWSVFGEVPYASDTTSRTLDLLVVIDPGISTTEEKLQVPSNFYTLLSYPWLVQSTSPNFSIRSTADTFVNDGEQIWILTENIRVSKPCVGFIDINSSLVTYLQGSGTLECHIYYRIHDEVNVEGGGSSGGGGSGSGSGSGGSSST